MKAKMVGVKLHHHCRLCFNSFEPMPYLQALQENGNFFTIKIGQKYPNSHHVELDQNAI